VEEECVCNSNTLKCTGCANVIQTSGVFNFGDFDTLISGEQTEYGPSYSRRIGSPLGEYMKSAGEGQLDILFFAKYDDGTRRFKTKLIGTEIELDQDGNEISKRDWLCTFDTGFDENKNTINAKGDCQICYPAGEYYDDRKYCFAPFPTYIKSTSLLNDEELIGSVRSVLPSQYAREPYHWFDFKIALEVEEEEEEECPAYCFEQIAQATQSSDTVVKSLATNGGGTGGGTSGGEISEECKECFIPPVSVRVSPIQAVETRNFVLGKPSVVRVFVEWDYQKYDFVDGVSTSVSLIKDGRTYGPVAKMYKPPSTYSSEEILSGQTTVNFKDVAFDSVGSHNFLVKVDVLDKDGEVHETIENYIMNIVVRKVKEEYDPFEVVFVPVNVIGFTDMIGLTEDENDWTEEKKANIPKVIISNRDFMRDIYPITKVNARLHSEVDIYLNVRGPVDDENIRIYEIVRAIDLLTRKEDNDAFHVVLTPCFSSTLGAAFGALQDTWLKYILGKYDSKRVVWSCVGDINYESDYNVVVLAHEIGHTFGLSGPTHGREHPATSRDECNLPDHCHFAFENYVHSENRYYSHCEAAKFVGRPESCTEFDPEADKAAFGKEVTSFMSYPKFYRTIQDKEYEHLYSQMTEEFVGPLTTAAVSPLTGKAITGLSVENNLIEVSGFVVKDNEIMKGFLDNVYLMDGGLSQENELTSGEFLIEFYDANYQLINDYKLDFETKIDYANFVAFKYNLPYTQDLRKIILKHNDQVLYTRTLSVNKPEITITSPITTETWSGKKQITWQASDVDNEDLSYDIVYSDDNGDTWSGLVVGYVEDNYEIDTTKLSDGEYLFKVFVNDGFNENEAVTAKVVVSNADSGIITQDNNYKEINCKGLPEQTGDAFVEQKPGKKNLYDYIDLDKFLIRKLKRTKDNNAAARAMCRSASISKK